MTTHTDQVSDLTQYGATPEVVAALERAGLDLATLGGLSREQLAQVKGLGKDRAESVHRALGRLMDVRVAETRTASQRHDGDED